MAQRDKRFATAARRMLWHKQGAKCHYCGSVTSKPQSMWEIHGPLTAIAEHRIPLSRGGGDVLDNMVIACRDCDELKGRSRRRSSPRRCSGALRTASSVW